MSVNLFKLSDEQKCSGLWHLLNTEVDEDGYMIVQYVVEAVYEDYAIAYDMATGNYERIYYTKDDTTDSLSIAKRETCWIIDVNEEEKSALNKLHELNGNTYAKVDEKFAEIESLNEKISENDTKIEELSGELSTLTTERDRINDQLADTLKDMQVVTESYTVAQQSIQALTTERDELAAFQKQTLDAQKKAIVDNYMDSLAEEVIETYMSNLDAYTAEELDMKLTYELKKAHPEMFSKQPAAYVPKDEPATGIAAILAKYEKH